MEEASSPSISPTLDLETPPFWRYPMTTRSTALCSSERIFASFKGSRLTPESSSKSSDLGARIHSVPRSSRRHGAQLEPFRLNRRLYHPFAGEGQGLLQVEPGSDNQAAKRNAIKHHVDRPIALAYWMAMCPRPP